MEDRDKIFEGLDDAMTPIHDYNEKMKEIRKKYEGK